VTERSVERSGEENRPQSKNLHRGDTKGVHLRVVKGWASRQDFFVQKRPHGKKLKRSVRKEGNRRRSPLCIRQCEQLDNLRRVIRLSKKPGERGGETEARRLPGGKGRISGGRGLTKSNWGKWTEGLRRAFLPSFVWQPLEGSAKKEQKEKDLETLHPKGAAQQPLGGVSPTSVCGGKK